MSHPGAVNFHPFTTAVAGGVPIIGTITDMANPDESFAVLGKDLLTTFAVWTEGQTLEATALRAASDRAQCVVPRVTNNGIVHLKRVQRESVAIVWPKNASGWGRPAVINRPEIFAIDRKHKWQFNGDRVQTVFGKNLSILSRRPTVIVQVGSARPERCLILHRDENEIKFELPYDHPPGAQKVWVHNGSGGEYGWSEPMSFTTEAIHYDSSLIVEVDAQAGATDQIKFENALLAAEVAGVGLIGGTLQFADRIYAITLDTYFTALTPGRPPVILQGHINGNTTLKATGTERQLLVIGDGSRILDMNFDGVVLSIRSKDVIIDNCTFRMKQYEGCLRVLYDQVTGGWKPKVGANLIVTNSTFHGESMCVNLYGSDMYFDRCKFYCFYDGLNSDYDGVQIPPGPNNGENHGISVRNGSNIIITNCEFESEDVANGKIMTRAVFFLRSGDHGNVVKGCKINWVGAFSTSSGIDRNTGETLGFHGDDYAIENTASHVPLTSTTVRLNVAFAAYTATDLGDATLFRTFTGSYDQGFIQIACLSGDCKGQIRTVVSAVDGGSSTTLITFDKPWVGFTPAIGDRFQVRGIFRNNVIADNEIDGVPDISVYPGVPDHMRVGVAFWVSSHNNIVQNNTFKNMLAGVYFANTNGNSWFQGTNYVIANRFEDMTGSSLYGEYPKFLWLFHGGAQGIPNEKFVSFGQVFRKNICSGSEFGIVIGTNDYDNMVPNFNRGVTYFDASYVMNANTGMINDIIENNSFDVDWSGTDDKLYAIALSANYTLFRNNLSPHAQAINNLLTAKTSNVLLIVNNVVVP